VTEKKYPTCDLPRDESSGGFFLPEEEETINITHLLSENEMQALIHDMCKKMLDECGKPESFFLVGIKTRGVPLAEWMAKEIEAITGTQMSVGSLDINLYRDDLSEVDINPIVKRTELPFSIAGKGVVLVDDVLYTGRTVRAALDALIDFGRPQYIKLASLIDRGFRELPIQGDFIGKYVETRADQNVKVKFKDIDGKNEVLVRG